MSDSLNILPRARWVARPLGRTRGRAEPDKYPGEFWNTANNIQCSVWLIPRCIAARLQREAQGDLFIFFRSLCSPHSGRRRNSISPHAPNHLAFAPRRLLAATFLHRKSILDRCITLLSASPRNNPLDISETSTSSIHRHPCATFDDK